MATPTSGQQAAKQNGTAQTSGGKKRHVASAAGAARYGKPIGSEIGGPRDANHAAIQQDQGARKNYGNLISGDAAAQRKALDGMSTEDLNKLADISFSFKSSDPKVVALRIAARNAQARRGIRVPVGQTQTRPAPGKAGAKVAPKKKAAPKAAPAKPAPRVAGRGGARALSSVGPASARLIELAAATSEHTASTGSFPVPDVAHVRKAIQAIGRAKPEQRPIIARHIIARAKALNCEHLVSDSVKHYARGHRQPGTVGMSRAQRQAVELAGKWKHGFIPLDAVALQSKMKGGKGKPWWGGGHGHSAGSGNAKKALHGSPKSGSSKDSGKLTNVVKSGPADSKPRGAKVDEPKLSPHRQAIKDQLDNPTPEHKAQLAEMKRLNAGKPGLASHEPGTPVSVKVPGKLSKQPGTVVGRTSNGDVTVKWSDSTGKSHTDTVNPQDIESRTVRTAKVDKAPSNPVQNRFSDPRAGLRNLSDSDLDKKLADAKKRAGTDTSVEAEVRKINMEIDARQSASRDVAKAPAPTAAQQRAVGGKEKVTSFDIGTGRTSTREVVRDSKGKVIGTNKTGSAKSAQTRAKNKSLGAFAPKNQPKADAGSAKVAPASAQWAQGVIAKSGVEGARQRVDAMEARSQISAPERAQLMALKAALAGKA